MKRPSSSVTNIKHVMSSTNVSDSGVLGELQKLREQIKKKELNEFDSRIK